MKLILKTTMGDLTSASMQIEGGIIYLSNGIQVPVTELISLTPVSESAVVQPEPRDLTEAEQRTFAQAYAAMSKPKYNKPEVIRGDIHVREGQTVDEAYAERGSAQANYTGPITETLYELKGRTFLFEINSTHMEKAEGMYGNGRMCPQFYAFKERFPNVKYEVVDPGGIFTEFCYSAKIAKLAKRYGKDEHLALKETKVPFRTEITFLP